MKQLGLDFYTQDALVVAPKLIGKTLVRKLETGEILRVRITETEAYVGENDTACHARAGRTKRTAPLYEEGGITYVYLCYGIHNLINVVTSTKDKPQAVLIRAAGPFHGPGKLTKALQIDRTLNEISLVNSGKIWIEDNGLESEIVTTKRIGIDYATEYYRNIEWRFIERT